MTKHFFLMLGQTYPQHPFLFRFLRPIIPNWRFKNRYVLLSQFWVPEGSEKKQTACRVGFWRAVFAACRQPSFTLCSHRGIQKERSLMSDPLMLKLSSCCVYHYTLCITLRTPPLRPHLTLATSQAALLINSVTHWTKASL